MVLRGVLRTRKCLGPEVPNLYSPERGSGSKKYWGINSEKQNGGTNQKYDNCHIVMMEFQ